MGGESCNNIWHEIVRYAEHLKSFQVMKIENSTDNSLVIVFGFSLQNPASLIYIAAVFLIKNYI